MLEGAAWTSFAYADDAAPSTEPAQADASSAGEPLPAEPSSEEPTREGEGATPPARENGAQLSEEVVLGKKTGSGAKEGGTSEEEQASSQIKGDVELSEENAQAKIGIIVHDGLTYEVQPDGATVALTGFDAAPLRGDFVVPSSVSSGSDRFAVTAIAERAFDGCVELVSISLPATVERVAENAFNECDSLVSIQVSKKNERFSSHDGMLFDKEGAALLRCPRGKQGAAVLPASAREVSPDAFSGCASLGSVQVAEGNEAYAAINGTLYTADRSTVVFFPAGAGDAALIVEEAHAIASGAFAGCALTSITALGFVRDIAADAFDAEARAGAVVALPAGEDYEARKAVWVAAGFSSFKEPAKPGDVSVPEPSEPEAPQASGLTYEVLGDYTLAVSWQGAEGPEGVLEIPATAEVGGVSYRVSAISDAAFAGRSGLTGVTLPASVTAVGERAFEATGITEAWLPASVATVGDRAFAACASLERVVALGTPWVADSALAECSGVSVYAPSGSDNLWNVGLPAAGNHLLPYGVDLPEEPLQLEVGQSADLIGGGRLDAPDPVEVSYAYAAKPLSVDPDGTATGKAEGSSEVAVTLTLDGVELACATRAVEVAASSLAPDADAEYGEGPSNEQIVTDAQLASVESPAFLIEDFDPLFQSFETGELVDDHGMINRVSLLATGESFEQKVASGQTLKFTILAEAEEQGVGQVSVSKSSDASRDPRGSLVIPATVQHDGSTYQVSAVADNGFSTAFYLNSVSFETGSTLSKLGTSSFNNCRSLAQVDLPESVATVGDSAFTNCTSLTSIDLSSAVSIGKECFLTCTMLSSVTFGAGLTSLPEFLFSNCGSLSSVFVEGSVSGFGRGAFDLVPTRNVVVYASDSQGVAAWLSASDEAGYSFKDVQVLGGQCSVSFHSQGGTPESFVQTVAQGTPAVQPVSPVREGYGLSGWLTSDGARWDFSLPVESDVDLYAQWTEDGTDGTFVYKMRPDGESLSVAAISPSSLTGHVSIPSEYRLGDSSYPVVEVAPFALYRSQAESVVIPNSIVEIGNQAVTECPQLKSVTFQEGSRLRIVKTSAFSKCVALTAIDIPDSVEILETSTFHGCMKLERVKLPSSIRSIEPFLFYDCRSLVSVDIPQSVASVGGHAFQNCLMLESVVLPESVTEIRDYTFLSNRSLRSFDMSSIASIGDWAFYDCRTFDTVSLPAVRSIGVKGFQACSKLRFVHMPFVESLGSESFANCGSLVDVGIPSSTTYIGQKAFANCTGLTSVSLPSNTTTLDQTFFACPKLSHVMAYSSMSQVAGQVETAFEKSVREAATVYLPAVGDDGDDYETMKTAWMGYGFANVAPAQGTLPTTDGADNARWSLDADGTLRIECTQPGAVIQDLGWKIGGDATGKYWDPVRGFVKRVSVDPGVDAVSMVKWFVKMTNLEAVDSLTIPPSTTSVSALFSECYSLRELPSGFTMPDTVQTCSHMFQYCSSLAELPDTFRISNNIYDNLNGFSVMFQGCSSLKRLPEGFEIPENTQVNSFSGMFQYCSSLEGLPQGFKLRSKLDNAQLYNTFDGCSSLRSLPDGFSLPEGAKQMHNLFNGCSSLEALPDDFRLPASTETAMEMFQGCSSLKRLPDGFKMPASILNCAEMFNGCSSLETLSDGFTTNSTLHCFNMFEGCSSLTALPDGFTISPKASSTSYMFSGCSSLASLPSGFSIPDSVTSAEGMFLECVSLTALPDAFAFPANAPVDPELKVFYCAPTVDGGRVPLRYAGSDAAILSYDWESQNRTLVTSDADMGEWGMRQVKYQVQSPDEAAGFPWETRTTAWTDKRGILADPGNLQLEGYTFSGWCADEACLVPFDFSKPVPEGVTELYGKWIIAGGIDERLPLETGTKGDVWWRVAADGTLSIEGAGQVADLQIGAATCTKGYWGPYRKQVKKIEMGAGVRARDMEAWFAQMPNLTDISDFAIPEGTENVQDLFQTCTSLARLPEGFHMPDSMIMATGIFAECTSLETLPESFVLTPNLVYANWMFNNCRALRSLPHGFTLPKVTSRFNFMFQNCTSLTSLPEGFGFGEPANVVNVEFMFNGCTKLTYIPASFKTTGLTAAAKATMGSSFKVPGSVPLETHYAGNLADFQGPDANYWSSQNRKIVSSVPSGTAYVNLMVPSKDTGAYELWMRQPAEVGATLAEPNAFVREGSTFTGWYVDDKLTEPYDFATGTVPVEGLTLYARYQANSGTLPTTDSGQNASWSFEDGTLTVKCDVPEAEIADLGLLKNDAEPGYWNFLRGEVTAVVVDASVKTANMDGWFRNMPSLTDISRATVPAGTKSAQQLFDGCSKLAVVPAGFTLPEGLENVVQMFRNCTSIEALPAGFALPAGVLNASGFLAYAPLTALPAGFTIPEGTTDASWMFTGCKNLATLPDGFSLPGSVRTAAHMFSECGLTSLPSSFLLQYGLEDASYLFFSNKKLETLPAGFKVPASVLDAQEMFNRCESLALLPEGFTFEGSVTKTCWTFSECSSLRALPEGFALPTSSSTIKSMFAKCSSLQYLPASFDLSTLVPELRTDASLFDLFYPGSAPLTTVYYDGSDLSKLAPEGVDATAYWNDKYRRTLVNDASALDPGVLLVEFKAKAEGENAWTTQRTLVSDAEGKVTELPADARYGYRFGGWCTDEACRIPALFSESLVSLDGDGDGVVTLYGSYTLRLSADVPLAAKVTVGASGDVVAAGFDMVSNTPKPLVIRQVVSEKAGGASKLIPRAGDLEKVRIGIALGDKTTSLPVSGSSAYVGFLDAASPGRPTVLGGSIGLELNGAQIDYQPGDDITSLAKLTWTIEAA